MKSFIFAFTGAILGGGVVWLLQGHTLYLLPQDMSYADLIAIILTAVSLMVGIFGVVMAILAIFGYRHFKGVVQKASIESARDVARAHVVQDLSQGGARRLIEQLVADFLETATQDGRFADWAEERRREKAQMNDIDRQDN